MWCALEGNVHDTGGQSPAQTAALFAEESQRWRKVIASAGIKAE